MAARELVNYRLFLFLWTRSKQLYLIPKCGISSGFRWSSIKRCLVRSYVYGK